MRNSEVEYYQIELKLNQMSFGDNKGLSYLNNNAIQWRR